MKEQIMINLKYFYKGVPIAYKGFILKLKAVISYYIVLCVTSYLSTRIDIHFGLDMTIAKHYAYLPVILANNLVLALILGFTVIIPLLFIAIIIAGCIELGKKSAKGEKNEHC